jgi:hypothetical protein
MRLCGALPAVPIFCTKTQSHTVSECVGPCWRVVLPAGPAVVGVEPLQQRLQLTHKGGRQVPAGRVVVGRKGIDV